jgi:prevent-host-death family protein
MTIRDYNVVMNRVGIADLKARLSEHLQAVRKGRTVTVMDRNTPVASIVPYEAEALELRRATRRPSELPLPAPLKRRTDSLAALLDDRGGR